MAKLLEGKVALVTGSGQGIGRALAKRLAAEGACVITNNRTPKRTSNEQISQAEYDSLPAEKRAEFEAHYEKLYGCAESTAKEIVDAGGIASPFYADISKFDEAEALVEHAVKTYGKLDIVCNIAGAFGFGSVCDITEETWDRVINTKLKGYFNVIHFAAPHLIENKWGRIINCSSRAFAGDSILHPEYCAANAGIIGLTRAVAIELFPHNITVNAFSPFAKTRASVDMLAAASLEDGSKYFMPGFKAPTMEISPEPEGMCPFLTWLCTDAAAHISGSTFSVFGNSISIFADPSERASVMKPAPEYWTIDELNRTLPRGLFSGYTSLAWPKTGFGYQKEKK